MPRATPHIYPKGCYFKSIADIEGKHITVMGLGLNGGGEAAVRFFLKHGAYVVATDMKSEAELSPTIESIENDETLDKSRLTYVLGEHRIEDFESADCVIKNPGVRIEGNKYLERAKAVETDISIFLSLSKAQIIAVTGSKGKSTTVSAIYYGLQKAGFKAFLGGNITVSPLTFLEETDGMTPVVLELSSWQLADLRGRGVLKPHISLITKIVPDHQNWYGNMIDYVNDKMLIFAEQPPKTFSIFDYDYDYFSAGVNPEGKNTGIVNWGNYFSEKAKNVVLRYSRNEPDDREFLGAWLDKDGKGYVRLPEEMMSKHAVERGETKELVLDELAVPGAHARLNALNAALVLRLMGIAPESVRDSLSKWGGIEHRLEYFHEWVLPDSGRLRNRRRADFYNDTCATVPEATAAALKSFDGDVVLIAGGTDKRLHFAQLASSILDTSTRPVQIYLLKGTATDRLIEVLRKNGLKYNGPFSSLHELLVMMKAKLPQQLHEGKTTILFSPGATSFGMFKNEFDRGNQFKDEVKKMFF